MLQNLQYFPKSQKFQLDNLVDFEKFCKTRIYLQRSAPIQPKRSEHLPISVFSERFFNRLRKKEKTLATTPRVGAKTHACLPPVKIPRGQTNMPFAESIPYLIKPHESKSRSFTFPRIFFGGSGKHVAEKAPQSKESPKFCFGSQKCRK